MLFFRFLFAGLLAQPCLLSATVWAQPITTTTPNCTASPGFHCCQNGYSWSFINNRCVPTFTEYEYTSGPVRQGGRLVRQPQTLFVILGTLFATTGYFPSWIYGIRGFADSIPQCTRILQPDNTISTTCTVSNSRDWMWAVVPVVGPLITIGLQPPGMTVTDAAVNVLLFSAQTAGLVLTLIGAPHRTYVVPNRCDPVRVSIAPSSVGSGAVINLSGEMF